jgi:two-component sensor histidine kinase
MLKSLLILFTGLLFITGSYAQSVIIKHLTKEDGLPSNRIYQINTDSKGYLWIASDKGLARYNGKTFETFTTSNGLPDNEIFGTREDYAHRLWITSFKGVFCYLQNGVFHTAANTPWLKIPEKSPTYSNLFRMEPDSTLIFPSNNGASFLLVKNEKIKFIDLTKASARDHEMPRPFFVVKYGTHYFKAVYHTKSVIIDSNGTVVAEIPNKKDCTYIAATSTSEDYVYSKHGLERVDGSIIKNTDKISSDLKRITTLKYLKTASNTFFATEDGLFLSDNTPIIKNIQFSAMAEDKDGNIWLGTLNSGILCIHPKYQNILNDSINLNVLIAKKTKDALYFIAEDGDFYKMHQGKAIRLYDNQVSASNNYIDKSRLLITNTGDAVIISRALNTGFYSTKHVDAIPNVYITHNGPDGKYHKFPISWDNLYSTNASIKNLFDFNGSIYVSTISTLFALKIADLATGKIAHRDILIDAKTDEDNRIYDRGINQMDSSLWFARADGMFALKNGNKSVRKELSKYSFRQFKFFKNYLIGFTDENKLLIDNIASAQVKLIANEDDCIWESICPIDDHRAIINTNNYYRLITFYAPDAKGMSVYNITTVENPFLLRQANFIATDTENCYFFNNGIITTVKNSLLFEKPLPPNPVFLSLQTQHATYPFQNEIDIPYNESKTINLQIDNISFVGQNLITEYSISTSNEDHWNIISSNEINLNTPGYGTYYIKLRSKTISSGFSKPAVLTLIVEKPFWASWWFIGLCAVVLILIVYVIVMLIIWRKLRKKQKEHDADMKYQQSEYKALNALMNPHFIFNSLNNIQSLINQDEKITANQYLVIFSKLIRQNMHNISEGFISLQEEILLIENYLNMEKLRFKELVSYSIDVSEDVDIEDIMIPPLMIQPLVENAVKHGLLPLQSTSGMIWIKVFEKDDVLFVEVEDNGVGLTHSLSIKDKLHKSYGLTNLQKRVDHLKKIQKKDINIDVKDRTDINGKMEGTKATIVMQLD